MVGDGDYGDDGAAYNNQGVGMSPSGLSTGYHWDMGNQVVYTEEAGHRSGASGLPYHT